MIEPPEILKQRGRDFWNTLTAKYSFREDELENLRSACVEMELVDKLQFEVDRDYDLGGQFQSVGSQGQSVAHPLVAELRYHRKLMADLMKTLNLPSEGQTTTAAQRSAAMREVAKARWDKQKGVG